MNITKEQMKTLRAAQQGEVDAAFMYNRLAGKVKSVEHALAFKRLAKDEMRHAEVFRAYTGEDPRPNPTKAILVPMMYKILGEEKVYPIIAKAEYEAANKYAHIISDFPEVEAVMNDENIHGDAVIGLLK